jgi:hypothetical protein
MNKNAVIILVMLTLMSSFCFAGNVHLSINQTKYDPFPALNGEYLELWINVVNDGTGKADNVVCFLEENYPIYLQKDENAWRTIGNLSPSMDSVIKYNLYVDDSALDEEKELNFKCGYDGSEKMVEQTLTISINTDKPEFAIGTISSEPNKLYSDSKENKLSMEIQNVGDGDAQFVMVELILPNGVTATQSYSDRDNLGTIGANSSKTAEFYIDLNESVSSGKQKATLILNYKTSNSSSNYKQTQVEFDLDIKEDAKFEVTSVSIEPVLVSGGTSKISLVISNVGSEAAEEVSVKVFKQSDQPFDFTKKYEYLGKIGVGENSTAIFEITAESGAEEKAYNLKFEIRHVSDSEVKVITKTIDLPITKSETNYLPFIMGGLVVLAIGAFAWKKIKK